jgi:hypothetical protein
MLYVLPELNEYRVQIEKTYGISIHTYEDPEVDHEDGISISTPKISADSYLRSQFLQCAGKEE